jgi:hypothetical protein
LTAFPAPLGVNLLSRHAAALNREHETFLAIT